MKNYVTDFNEILPTVPACAILFFIVALFAGLGVWTSMLCGFTIAGVYSVIAAIGVMVMRKRGRN